MVRKISVLLTLAIIMAEMSLVMTASQPGKPKSVEPLLWCNSCQAIVREMLKKLGSKKREFQVRDKLKRAEINFEQVIEIWETICDYKNFNIYEFPPPDMKKGCEQFISEYEEEMIDGLVKRNGNDGVEHEICYNVTKVQILLFLR